MLAVSFFFVLAGVILLCTGTVGLFVNLLGKHQMGNKRYLLLAGGGLISVILGLLMAMT